MNRSKSDVFLFSGSFRKVFFLQEVTDNKENANNNEWKINHQNYAKTCTNREMVPVMVELVDKWT